MFKLLLLFFIAGYAHAISDKEHKAEFVKLVMSCTKDHPVDMEELTKLQKYIVPKKPEVKCLLACAYRSNGLLTKDGRYDIEKAYKTAEQLKDGDEKRLENGKKLADLCAKVNEVEVTDGEKGCERATLIFKCIVENLSAFGFKV